MQKNISFIQKPRQVNSTFRATQNIYSGFRTSMLIENMVLFSFVLLGLLRYTSIVFGVSNQYGWVQGEL